MKQISLGKVSVQDAFVKDHPFSSSAVFGIIVLQLELIILQA